MTAGRLRPMQEGDLGTVLIWRNSDRIRSCMFSDSVIAWDEHVRWFRQAQSDDTTVTLLYDVGALPVGVTSFTNIDRRNRKCMWGFYVGPENQPRGTGLDMGRAALDYAFSVLNVRKLSGEVLESNIASIRFHEKLGFAQEGLFRQHVFKDGVYQDVRYFSIFQEHWLANRGEPGS